jgi:tetratricopeptide (TPR) repeat protein
MKTRTDARNVLGIIKTVALYSAGVSIVLAVTVGALRITLLSLQGIPFTTIEEDLQIYKDPNNLWAYFNRGWIRSQWGDRTGAIADFTQAIRIESTGENQDSRSLAGLYDDRAQVYEHLAGSIEDDNPLEAQKNYKLAISDYQKAAELLKAAGDTSVVHDMVLGNIQWVRESLSKVNSAN